MNNENEEIDNLTLLELYKEVDNYIEELNSLIINEEGDISDDDAAI